MVKNSEWIIPKNIQKPVETVYELKDQVPSFEEFMKDYQVDEKVNYDDLSGGSVGEVGGYGPCERYCSRKDNPQCTCYIDDGYIPLNSACPSCRYSPDTKRQWYHAYCGSQMYISTSAYIKCMKCPKTLKWKEWKFRCSHSEHKSYESPISGQIFLTALNIASSMHADDPRINRMIVEIGYEILKDSLNR
jgi:hypothetical protein